MKIKKRRYIQFAFAAVALIVVVATVLVNSPRVQQRVSVLLATELENRIGTRVSLGGVHWLFPTDIVVDSLSIDDQEGEQLLSVERMAAKVEWKPLFLDRQLSIRNVRLFQPDIHLYRADSVSDYNYQFLIDAFASKKEKKKESQLSLRINTLLIRDGHVCHSQGENPSNSFAIDDLSAQLSLKMLSADSVSVIVRHMSLKEQSGWCVDDLYFRLVANHHGATLANFQLDLPHSTLRLDTVWASFPTEDSQSSLIVKGRVLPSSHITPVDLAPLVPQVGNVTERIYFGADFIGSPSRINLKALNVHSAHRDLVLRAQGRVESNPLGKMSQGGGGSGYSILEQLASVNLKLNEASFTESGWALLAEQAPDIYNLIPQELIRIGDITAIGDFCHDSRQTTLDLQANTDAGDITAHMVLDSERRYEATLNGDGINVARVVPGCSFEQTDLTLQTQGTVEGGQMANIGDLALKGTVSAVASHTRILGYEYEGFSLEGSYAPNHYEAALALDDSNGTFSLEAAYLKEKRVPRYTATLKADSLNLHAMKLIGIHEDATFSTRLKADLWGVDLDNLIGKVEMDSFTMHRPTEDYLIKEVALYASYPEEKMLSLKSDFMDATLRGKLTYHSVWEGLLGHLHHSLPSLCHEQNHNHTVADNLYLLNVWVYNTEPLRELLLMPISITGNAQFEALVNDVADELKVTASVPHLEYDGNVLKGISVDCHSAEQGIDLYMGATLQNEDAPAVTASLVTHAENDKMDLGLLWNSNPVGAFEGTFHTRAAFALNKEGKLTTVIETDSTQATLNHSEWKLSPFSMGIAPGRVSIDNLCFANDTTQYLRAQGAIAREETDTLQVDFTGLDLGYLLSLVNFESVSFDGEVSGHADMANLYSENPYVEADISAKNFAFSKGLMGNLKGDIHWDNEESQLKFVADVWEDTEHTTLVDGVVDLELDELWIDIDADSINVLFLNDLLKSFMNDVKGHATGHLVVGGPMDAIDLNGALMTDVSFNLTPTDVDYHFRDSLRFTPGVIHFDGIEVFDMRGQKAIVAGTVPHDKLRDFSCDLYVDVQNVLGIDLPDTGNDSFYTTIYGTGGVQIKGTPTTPLTIDIQAQPEKGSLFALNLASQNVSSGEAFITFTDHSSTRNVPTVTTNLRDRRRRRVETGSSSSLDLDIMAHVTPDATLKLVMNQAVDDHISVSGSGDLQIGIHDDDINLFGTYTVNRGFYRLSLQDVINKNFDVLSGSTVAFNGDPMAARLDITARHLISYVPLRDLSPEMTGNVHVNCLLNIGGTLDAPTVAFDLELPQGTEEEKAILRSYTSTEEQMNLQFIYLLGLGKFYTPDVAQNNAATSNMESLISSTISGQINNLLSGIISNDNWNLASNIRADNMMAGASELEGENWENMEIEGILEGRLLDNRLLINGNFGYRENPMYATNFIGDFDIRYLLTGGLSLKGYNKTNDRYFSKTSLTTQGVGLVFERDFDRLISRRKRKKSMVAPADSVATE